MRRVLSLAAAVTLTLAASGLAAAQTKTVTGEMTTVTATVEAIDTVARALTVKGANGTYTTIVVPDSMKQFSAIKVGDTIQARYYDNVAIRVKPAGEPAVDAAANATTPGKGASPARTEAKQRTITAVITSIDPKVPSITFKGETVKWEYSSKVEDKAALAKVKVGDRVDITWTEAVVVSVVPPAKK
jgi:hypothetical protein